MSKRAILRLSFGAGGGGDIAFHLEFRPPRSFTYSNRGQMERDLAYLREKNLADTSFINARRDGQNRPVERIQVVMLTEEGRNVLLWTGQFRHDQEIYAGLVIQHQSSHL